MQATEELDAVGRRRRRLVLGRYRLGERLGAGGFGTVYAARDERLGRAVAVKVIPADGRRRERAPARGARRRRGSTTRASSRVFDAGEEDGARYLVSELVDGRTLAAARGGRRAVRPRRRCAIGLALADALAHAHERGVIHRDVKPQNVIVPDAPALGARGVGQARPTSASPTWPATSRSRAPATSSARSPTWRPSRPPASASTSAADLYSLALVLYEALAGRQPGARGLARPRPRARSARALPPLRRSRARPAARSCARRSTARCARARRSAATLDDLADALADALPAVSDEGGTVAPHPLERRPAGAAARAGQRSSRAAAAGGARGGGAGRAARPSPRCRARRRGRGGAPCCVALLPRAGWLLAAAAAVALVGFGTEPRPGAALVVLVAVAAPAAAAAARRQRLVAARRSRRCSGLIGLAGAYPALAGRPRRAGRARRARRARRAGGCCSPSRCSAARCCSGRRPASAARGAGTAAPSIAAGDVLAPLVSSGALLLAALWALAARRPAVARARPLAGRRHRRRDAPGPPAWRRPRPRSASGSATASRARSRAGWSAGALAGGVVRAWPARRVPVAVRSHATGGS